mmetsp:Transcript_10361/g.28835  ORF Transcript_10361/g.28835 Transcript_10361/m.28835 type:complete len:263 (+) Transcript_10361:537-1325(+)
MWPVVSMLHFTSVPDRRSNFSTVNLLRIDLIALASWPSLSGVAEPSPGPSLVRCWHLWAIHEVGATRTCPPRNPVSGTSDCEWAQWKPSASLRSRGAGGLRVILPTPPRGTAGARFAPASAVQRCSSATRRPSVSSSQASPCRERWASRWFSASPWQVLPATTCACNARSALKVSVLVSGPSARGTKLRGSTIAPILGLTSASGSLSASLLAHLQGRSKLEALPDGASLRATPGPAFATHALNSAWPASPVSVRFGGKGLEV